MKINVVKLFSLDGHKDCVYALEPGNDEDIFYSGGGDGLVVEWDLRLPEQGNLIAKMRNSVYALCLLKEEKILAVGQNFEGVHFLDLASKKELGSIKTSNSQIFDIKRYRDLLFVGTGDGTLFIIDTKTKSIIRKIKLADKSIRTLAINDSLGEMAVGLSDNTIRVLDLEGLKQKYQINAHKLSVFSLVYDPRDHSLISASRDAHIKTWNALDHYQLNQSLPAHMYAINSLVISPDLKYFVSGSMDKTIKIWDLDTFSLLKVIDSSRHAGHTSSVNKVICTSGKSRIISCSDDRKISIWDLSFN